MSELIVLIRGINSTRRIWKTPHRGVGREAARWDRPVPPIYRPACGATCQPPPSYVGYPPPLSLHLRHPFRSV
jgi:hypothetical protein